jgi:hypothetical protein
MSHIFISYSSKDSKADDGILSRLIARLRRNFKIWLDQTGITGGNDWQDALKQAIRDSSALVYIVSPNSVDSDWCQTEIKFAHSNGIPIIPYIYQKADVPFVISSIHHISHEDDPQAPEKLETALKEQAPDTYIHGEPILVTENLLNNAEVTFRQAAEQTENEKLFFAAMDSGEVKLIGLPLVTTTFCSALLVGRADDTLAYKPLIQVALQFSGRYDDADFPSRIGKHFLQAVADFPLRMLLVRGPAQITYNESKDLHSLNYVLDPPTGDQNQWADALHAVRSALRLLHKNRENPALQLFVQGPVAGITYELGAEHRGLLYRAEHYQYDRDNQRYYRVLGSIE